MRRVQHKTVHLTPLTLEAARPLVDTYVEEIVNERLAQAEALGAQYETLWHAIKTLYTAGGKRLRPYLTLLTYQAFGGENIDDILPIAASQELLHQAMLIHDDIIDRDIIRYGVPNITGQFEGVYRQLISDSQDRRHFAESSALLAGDLLISEAHAQIARSSLDPTKLAAAQHTLTTAIFHVVGGELLDTEASFRPNGVIDPLTVATHKTASYSFISPLTMGAVLAGVTETQLDILKDLGNSIGIAFQLRDDVIGIFGDEKVTGKSTDGDLREGKQTLLIDEFYKRANDDQKAIFTKSFGKRDASIEEIEQLRHLLEVTGTKDAIETYIADFQARTTAQLQSLGISDEYRAAFAALITKCLVRNK